MSGTESIHGTDATSAHPPNDIPVQGPLDREVLAAHFQGYELERLITVILKPVELVGPPVKPTQEGGGG